MKLAALLLAGISVFAQTAPKGSPEKSSIDKAKLEAYLRNMDLWIPQVNVSIEDPKPYPYMAGFNELTVHLSYNTQGKDEHYLISQDGRYILKGDAYDTTKSPFQYNIDHLKTEQAPNYGKAGAPVTLVVFGDFECPLCKQETEAIRKNIAKDYSDKVRVYFKDFPLESIHPWARQASVTGRCILKQGQDAFWKYHDWIYDKQEGITPDNLNAQVMAWAPTAGVDTIQLGRCMDSKTTDSEVNASIADAHALGLDATPTNFLNGRKMVGSITWDVMEQLIKMEIDQQAKAVADAEKCCTVQMPTVGAKAK